MPLQKQPASFHLPKKKKNTSNVHAHYPPISPNLVASVPGEAPKQKADLTLWHRARSELLKPMRQKFNMLAKRNDEKTM